MKRIFKVSKGSTIGKDKAQVYGEYLWKLKEENGDVLTPEHVVNCAKTKSSPLHDYFEWNNDDAGSKYRLWQARYLIGRIEVIVKCDDSEEQVRAFHNINVIHDDESDNVRGYVTVKDIRENPDYLQIVLDNAIKEIVSWKNRYNQYQKLGKFKPLKKVFKAVKETEKELVAV